MAAHILLDPTAESSPTHRPAATRLGSLQGVSVGLVDISKRRGDVFLDHLELLVRARGIDVIRYTKPTHAKPAPVDLRQEIATECGAVIQALAD